MRRLGTALLLAALVAVCPALGAQRAGAGTPGTWTQVTDASGRNIDHVAVARTSDGVLHAVWRRRIGPL
jgi:hypothetical protein